MAKPNLCSNTPWQKDRDGNSWVQKLLLCANYGHKSLCYLYSLDYGGNLKWRGSFFAKKAKEIKFSYFI